VGGDRSPKENWSIEKEKSLYLSLKKRYKTGKPMTASENARMWKSLQRIRNSFKK
jgi:hypothetical protein|tara:strand:- start:1733 stop:1897 length:165 start_codon:yes stop_codon:yes gene_type:complete